MTGTETENDNDEMARRKAVQNEYLNSQLAAAAYEKKTTNALDMMRTMDGSAYTEYQKISKESSNEDRQLNALKYLTNWYEGAVKKNPSMVDNYEKQSEEYVEKNVKDQKLDATFSDIKTENKAAFFESLKVFQNNNPNFLSSIINRELASKFWSI